MKKLYSITTIFFAILLFVSCDDMFNDIEPLDKVSGTDLLANPAGLNTLLANIYYNIPMEDFNYRFNAGFNRRGWGGGLGELSPIEIFTDNAGRSSGTGIGPNNGANYWPYTDVRTVNQFMENLEIVRENGTITEDEYNRLKSEAHFARAYMYFGLAKRKGGVPIITETLDKYYDGGESVGLYIPRSTEEETWNFVLDECDKAAQYLPEELSTQDGKYRASKYAALALKSRAALHAASLAKYWNNAPLSSTSDAVSQKLVGLNSSLADQYYKASIDASEAIINSGRFALYMPNPSSPEEAATNYYQLFQTTGTPEFIFGKAYAGETLGSSHNFDNFYSPHQAATGFHKDTRYSIMLDLVDMYEDLSSNGASAPVKTRTDGAENQYIANPTDFNVNLPFIKYDDPTDIFKDKDPRFHASVLYQGSEFRNVEMVIQAGLIDQNGGIHVYTNDSFTGKDGKTYWSLGAESGSQATGFFGMDNSDNTNYTTTGFTIKKFLTAGPAPLSRENGSSTVPWIDFRLAEIYLNYAEAVVENGSGHGNAAKAVQYLNDIRHRAGLSGNVPLTLENVKKERRVELAFENHRMWDLVRWREFHILFSNNNKRHALLPILDLREEEPKYIFIRANWIHDERSGGNTFQSSNYYQSIPNTNINKLVPNNF
jgi:hypothetical protein